MDDTRGFRKLLAYQRAEELASLVYRTSREVAKTDRWVASQLARAAISVPANIAEGYGRGSLGDYTRFVGIARGSLTELEFHLQFISREGLGEDSAVKACLSLQGETARLVTGLWQSLKAKNPSSWDQSGRSVLEPKDRSPYESDDDD